MGFIDGRGNLIDEQDDDVRAQIKPDAAKLLEACKCALYYYEAFRDSSPVGPTEEDDIQAVKDTIAKSESTT